MTGRRVCFHDPRLGSIAGGGESVTLQLAGWLAEAGIEVTLCMTAGIASPLLRRFLINYPSVRIVEISPAGSDEVAAAIRANPWLESLMASDRLAPQSVAFGLGARGFHREEGFDLVVVSFLPDLAGWETSCPVLLNILGLPPNREVAALELPLLSKCHYRTFASEYVRKEFAILTGEGWGPVLPGGIDEVFFAPVVSRPSIYDAAFAGRLVPRKGLTTVLEALRHLKSERGLLVHLAVGGDGPQRAELMRWAERLGVGEQISWLGTLGPPELVRLLDESTVFVYPTLLPEAFGCSAVEAMARGKVLITTNLGGTADYAVPGQNALVCFPSDARSLAEALETALSDTGLWDRIGQQARTDVQRYHPLRVRAEWEEFFSSILRD